MQLLNSAKRTTHLPLDRDGKPIPSNRLLRIVRALFVEKGTSLAAYAKETLKDNPNVRKALVGDWANGEVSENLVLQVIKDALKHDVRWLTAQELAAEIGVDLAVAERIIGMRRYMGKVLQTQQNPQPQVLWDLTTNKPVIGE